MRKPFLIFILFFVLLSRDYCWCQVIDNTSSFRNIQGEKYLRLHYENDFFSASDQYYSQGVSLEFVSPWLRKNFLSGILLHPKNGKIKYGMSVEQDAYTPSSIRHDEILYGDRPYAGVLLLKTFLIAADSIKNRIFSSSFSFGVVGSAAGGKEMQTSIHRWTGNFLPLGWQHQVKNDVAINYQVNLEKKILLKKYFLADVSGKALCGTLNDKVSAGLVIMTGLLEPPFQSPSVKKNFRIYFYEQPLVSAIGYDATLQGGLFNRENEYVISSADVSRITFQNNFGVVIKIKRIYLEYFQSFLTKEFISGSNHRWGGIRMGVAI